MSGVLWLLRDSLEKDGQWEGWEGGEREDRGGGEREDRGGERGRTGEEEMIGMGVEERGERPNTEAEV